MRRALDCEVELVCVQFRVRDVEERDGIRTVGNSCIGADALDRKISKTQPGR